MPHIQQVDVPATAAFGILTAEGQVYSEHQATLTPSGTTETIDWNSGNSVTVDFGSATGDVTLTLNNPVSGGVYRILVIQGGTTRNMVWPAAVKWPAGGAPTISAADDNEDLITLSYNGTSYYGSFEQNYS